MSRPTNHPQRSRRAGARALVAGAVMLGGLGVAGTAAAQSNDGNYVGSSTTVLNTQVQRAPSTVAAAQATKANTDVRAAELAFTGSDVLPIALVGGALVAAGAGVLVLRRRQVEPTPA